MVRKRSEIKVSASDALEFEPVNTHMRRPSRRGLKVLVVLILLCGISAVGWEVFVDDIMSLIGNVDKEVPLLRSEAGPIKVRPKTPGGLQVPYRDKLVYKRLSGREKDAMRVERLLPPPESPIPLPSKELALLQPRQPKTARIPSLSDVKSTMPPKPAPTFEAGGSSENKKDLVVLGRPLNRANSLPSQAMPKEVAPKPKQPNQEVKKKPPKTSNMPLADKKSTIGANFKSYQVQLAASRTSEGAQAEWIRLREKNLDLIGSLKLTIVRVDLGKKKGVFFRLRLGPLSNGSEARQLCNALKKRSVGCLVVKPGT